METFKGRTQTTKGIWIGKGVGIGPCTIAIDLEGTDGKERGEDDTAFEKQSALFALAISDIVLTPLKFLEPQLKENIHQIWDTVLHPQTETKLSEFFNIEVRALPRLQNEEQSKEQVAQLRQQIIHSVAPGGLASHRQGVPGSGFSFSAQKIWKDIREDKDLDLPAHKTLVAMFKCEEIANEKLNYLTSDEGLSELEAAVKTPVDFGRKLGSLLNKYLLEYDKDAVYFDESVRAAKRQQLEYRALSLMRPAFEAMLAHLHSKTLDKFKYDLELSLKRGKAFAVSILDCTQACMLEFDKGFSGVVIEHADWDASKVKEKLHCDIKAHAVSELRAAYKKQLTEALNEHVGSLFELAGCDTWASIRQCYKRETDNAVSGFSADLSGFEPDRTTYDGMVEDLKEHARSVVERKAKEAAGRVLIHMNDRFSEIFNRDKGILRTWTGKEDIRVIAKEARSEGVIVLSVMAAIRLDGTQDEIQSFLKSNLVDGLPPRKGRNMSIEGSSDSLASSTWPEHQVHPKNTLITPAKCKLIWEYFVKATDEVVTQAQNAQKAHKRSKEDKIRNNTELVMKGAALFVNAVALVHNMVMRHLPKE